MFKGHLGAIPGAFFRMTGMPSVCGVSPQGDGSMIDLIGSEHRISDDRKITVDVV